MDNKKKNWILGAVGLVVALIIIGVTMGNTILARLAPDKYVLLSMLEMKNMVEKEKNKFPISPDKEISGELNLKEIDGMYDDYKDMVEGWGMFFTIANSITDDVKINTGLQNNGVSLMDLSIYSSGSQLGVKIPGLLDQYVMVDLLDFKEKYDDSILSRYLGDIEKEDIDLLDDAISLTKTSLKNQGLGSDTLLNTHLENLMTELAKKMDVKYMGTTKVLIANKEKRGNKFLAIIDAEDLKTFIASSTKLILNDPEIRGVFETYPEYLEMDEFEQSIYEAIDQIEFSDLEINLAIDHKKQISNTQMLTSVEIEGEEIDIETMLNLSGGENILNTLNADLLLKSLDRSLNLTLFKDLEREKDNFALASHVTIEENTNLSFEVLGDFLILKDELARSLTANKIEIKAEGLGNKVNILGSGNFKIENLKEKDLKVPEEELLDLFSLGPIQIFDILSRVGVPFYDIGKMLNIL